MLLSPVGPLPYAAFEPLFYSTPRGMVLASWIPLGSSGDGLTARWVPPDFHGSVEAGTITDFTFGKYVDPILQNFTICKRCKVGEFTVKGVTHFTRFAQLMIG